MLFEQFKNIDVRQSTSEYNKIIVRFKMFAKEHYAFASHIVD